VTRASTSCTIEEDVFELKPEDYTLLAYMTLEIYLVVTLDRPLYVTGNLFQGILCFDASIRVGGGISR
jgi:hypothetical protein